MMEITKVVISAVMLQYEWSAASPRTDAKVPRTYYDLLNTSTKLSVPAGVYFVQNMLAFFALQRLDSSVFSALIQFKIFTTALFSVTLLQRSLSFRKWRALGTLVAGVVLILTTTDDSSACTPTSGEVQVDVNAELGAGGYSTVFMGFMAVVAMTLCSGFAGVYFEKVLKDQPSVSIWARNFQLGVYSIVFGLAKLVIFDLEAIVERGFFYGHSMVSLTSVLLGSCGGLLVAMVVKYADNILKGFANATAIILASILSVWLFETQLGLSFCIGAFVIVTSLFNYNEPDAPKPVALAVEMDEEAARE